jgi:prophage antirepressor-like protein
MNQNQDVQFENLKVVYMKNGIEIIEHDDGLWIGAENIGNKIGYKKPRQSINQIYQRYSNSFKERETKIVESIETDKNGKKQKRTIRIFSIPKGAMRLCILSRNKNCLEVHDEILETYE